MYDFIKDDSSRDRLHIRYSKQHFEKFKTYPYIIGMFWDDTTMVEENIIKAIKDNKPYNEYELLSKEEQEAYNKGKLLF